MEYLTAVFPYLPEELQDSVAEQTWQLWERIWSQLSEEERSSISSRVRADRAVEQEEARRMLPLYLAMKGVIGGGN